MTIVTFVRGDKPIPIENGNSMPFPIHTNYFIDVNNGSKELSENEFITFSVGTGLFVPKSLLAEKVSVIILGVLIHVPYEHRDRIHIKLMEQFEKLPNDDAYIGFVHCISQDALYQAKIFTVSQMVDKCISADYFIDVNSGSKELSKNKYIPFSIGAVLGTAKFLIANALLDVIRDVLVLINVPYEHRDRIRIELMKQFDNLPLDNAYIGFVRHMSQDTDYQAEIFTSRQLVCMYIINARKHVDTRRFFGNK